MGMADPVVLREHVVTVLTRFSEQGERPTKEELRELAGMGRNDLDLTLTLLVEDGSVEGGEDGRYGLPAVDVEIAEGAEEEADGSDAPTNVMEATGGGDDYVVGMAEDDLGPLPVAEGDAPDRRWRVDWDSGGMWSTAGMADEAAAEGLEEAGRRAQDTMPMQIYVVPASEVLVYGIRHSPAYLGTGAE